MRAIEGEAEVGERHARPGRVWGTTRPAAELSGGSEKGALGGTCLSRQPWEGRVWGSSRRSIVWLSGLLVCARLATMGVLGLDWRWEMRWGMFYSSILRVPWCHRGRDLANSWRLCPGPGPRCQTRRFPPSLIAAASSRFPPMRSGITSLSVRDSPRNSSETVSSETTSLSGKGSHHKGCTVCVPVEVC